MKRAIVALVLIAALTVAVFAWSHRVVVHAQDYQPTAKMNGKLPAGTKLRVSLVEGLTDDSKAGDLLQCQPLDLIPDGTRCRVRITAIENAGDRSKVSLQLVELILPNRVIPVHSVSLTTSLTRISDLALMGRAVGAMLGGAVGAARSASRQRNPAVGAARVGGRTSGQSINAEESVLVFDLVDPVDLTG